MATAVPDAEVKTDDGEAGATTELKHDFPTSKRFRPEDAVAAVLPSERAKGSCKK